MPTGEEILGPLLDPAHRSLELFREVADEGFLREGRQLQAEGPPHARLDDLDLVLAHPQRLGQKEPQGVRRLGRRPERQLVAVALVEGEVAARLDRGAGVALRTHGPAHDAPRTLEARLGVAMGLET